MKFHIGLARSARAPTEIRTLNGAPPIIIGTDDDEENFSRISSFLDGSPSGLTPLCRHIRDVIEKIRIIEPNLTATGQKACVVIVTDGEASDGDLRETMRPLNDLPVFIVVRLCTDDTKVVEYWNSIDDWRFELKSWTTFSASRKKSTSKTIG